VYLLICSNIVFFILLWGWAFKKQDNNKLTLFSVPLLNLGIRVKPLSLPKSIIFPLLLLRLMQVIFKFMNGDLITSNLTKTEAWQESVVIEEVAGSGAGGLFATLWLSLYFVILIIGLSKDKVFAKKTIRIFFITEIIVVADILINGLYRSPLVFEIIQAFIVYNFFYKRLSTSFIRKLAVVGIFLMPFYFSVAAYVRDGHGLEAGVSNFSLVTGLSGVATAFEFLDLYERVESGELNLENGKQFLYNAVSFIPRGLWPSKPFTSFSYRLSTDLYGQMGVDGWVHTYTLWGEGYLQYGVAGTYIATLLLFLLLYIIYMLIRLYPVFSCVVSYLIISKFPILVRGDLSSFYGAGYKIFFSMIFSILVVFILNLVVSRDKLS
jgi:oligosaccharide repeat unit polymerase